MRRKIEHRVVTMDGQSMIVLTVADFERLDAARRQLGASEAQAHQLRQQLKDTRRRVARLEGLLAAPIRPGLPGAGACHRCPHHSDDLDS
jgi:hypothetical protein